MYHPHFARIDKISRKGIRDVTVAIHVRKVFQMKKTPMSKYRSKPNSKQTPVSQYKTFFSDSISFQVLRKYKINAVEKKLQQNLTEAFLS